MTSPIDDGADVDATEAGDSAPPVITGFTGSAGTQVAPIGEQDVPRSVEHAAAPVDVEGGLKPVIDAKMLMELVKSDVRQDDKEKILAYMVISQQQSSVAEQRARAIAAEKELGKTRKKLKDAEEELGTLRGDVRVRDNTIRQLRAHVSRSNRLALLSSVACGVGGAFVGRSLPAVIIAFTAGAALFFEAQKQPPRAPDEPT